MEIGSLVKCIKEVNWSRQNVNAWYYIHDLKIPEVNNIYMVRGFYGDGNSIYLEEIVNRNLPEVNVEPSFNIDAFVEVLGNINIIEEIEKSNLIEA